MKSVLALSTAAVAIASACLLVATAAWTEPAGDPATADAVAAALQVA